MVTPDKALSEIPSGLRYPLIGEFNNIVTSFIEHRWTSSELHGGRFCEVVYSILDGYSKGQYDSSPSKPQNFADACRKLENHTHVPRSFQILIPRLLLALYEIRNNRNVGHIGGDVNPDFMDSSITITISSWILAELIRVFHNVSTQQAQKLVDSLVERRLLVIWKSGDIKRVLKTDLSLKDQIILLLHSSTSKVTLDQLFSWIEPHNRSYFNKVIEQLHTQRFLEYYRNTSEVEILPPGTEYITKLLKELDKNIC